MARSLCLLVIGILCHGIAIASDFSESDFNRELRAAEFGDKNAQNLVGNFYYRGQGVKRNYIDSFRWWLKAAEKGHPCAQNSLGLMFEEGRGVNKNDKEAVKFFESAAEQDHREAQYNLGRMYRHGYGVKSSHEKAVKWWRAAANSGYALAQNSLGLMLLGGLGVDKNEPEAIRLFQSAANHGYHAAQYNLGLLTLRGDVIKQSDEEAVKWFKKAAAQGHSAAQCYLAEMYEFGRGGLAKDYFQAIKYYELSQKQKNKRAQIMLSALLERISSSGLKEVCPSTDSPECSICLDEKPAMAFIPCGHTVCKTCSSKYQVKCPTCSESVSGMLKLYF